MNKQILLIAVLLISTAGFAQWGKKISGNGKMTTETRTTSDYDGISCAGSLDYVLVSGKEGKITLEGEENLLEYIVTEVKNGTLTVKVKDKINLKSSLNKTIKITIPFKDINAVSLAGSGDLWGEDTISASNLDVSLAGSGDIKLDIRATSVESSISGSGDITLSGKTTNLEASIAGSGDFEAFDLDSDNTEVSISGSGDAQVVSNTSIKGRVSGSGDIDFKGNPTKEDTKVSGSGSITGK